MSPHHTSDEFLNLVNVISKLRAENGCPWDRKQTPSSLVKYLLEEAKELAGAINHGQSEHVREEAGDLLYILILTALIYGEKGEFTLEDVLTGITEKMIRRHPHVFAGLETGSESELRRQWEAIKSEEKTSHKKK